MSGRSELAYDEAGNRFPLPANASGWRVRRFNKPGQRGGCEIVYGEDSTPLILDVEADASDFRDAVNSTPGRYRLDAVDDGHHMFKDVPPAYLVINEVKASASASRGGPPPTTSSLEYALVEAVRSNSAALATMAAQIGSVAEASAAVLRAADASGLTKRMPLASVVEPESEGEDDDEDDDGQGGAARQGSDLVTVCNQLMTMFQTFQQMHGGPATSQATRAEESVILDAEPAAPHGGPEPQRASSGRSAPAPGHGGPVRMRDANQHFREIQAQLTPDERAFLERAITKLSIQELMGWRDQLAQLSVAEVVALLRAEMAKSREAEVKP